MMSAWKHNLRWMQIRCVPEHGNIGRHAAARDLRMTPNVAMRQSRFIRTSRAAPRGQASIEYVVICLVLVLALFHGDPSPMDRMLSAIQHHYARFTYSMSLP